MFFYPIQKGVFMATEPKVENLSNMLQYQENAVVSKTLVQKETGTVTLFAFAKGQGLSEHTAPFDAMVQVIEGEVEIRISGKPFIVQQGEILIMPANEPHALTALTDYKMLLTLIRTPKSALIEKR